ncbi:MAG: hypothetical protein ACTTJJ_09250 [Prevotella fusca]|uniref:hypothetical protein n=1 Tax=Prevotella fusca TaxID=589436 RepID=UPI003FA0712C
MMKTKQLFKSHLFSLAALFSIALTAISCANEDIAQNGKDGDNGKGFATFVADAPTQTRTSIDYATGNFYWEEGDKIYVKDDDGTIQVSNAVDAAHAHSASFKFKVPGKFRGSATYKVYYLGKNGGGNQVTIPTAQTQTTPNATDHLGNSGDYGTATATGTLGGSIFSFQLEHQPAYLVFQPYTSNAVLKNCYLTKIEVNSDDDIAETYTIDPNTGNLNSSAGSKQIVLTTKDPVTGSTNEKGFSFTNATSISTADKVYMLIKPGAHTLKVRYWVKDYDTNVEGTITKVLPSFNYDKNTYYDMTANLNVKDYDGDKYYMWDAQQNYWSGHEWNSANPWQPTLMTQPANSNYPQGNTDPRYYNEGVGSGRFDATQSCATLPNVNELTWYAAKGDPRWDRDELWTTMGHLYKGGMWFKKKSVLQGEGNYNSNTAVDRTDWRTNGNRNSWSVSQTLPSAADANNYFYLPALGWYNAGLLILVGYAGFYWSSSADLSYSNVAYSMTFDSGFVYVSNGSRTNGLRVDGFE